MLLPTASFVKDETHALGRAVRQDFSKFAARRICESFQEYHARTPETPRFFVILPSNESCLARLPFSFLFASDTSHIVFATHTIARNLSKSQGEALYMV